MPRKNKMINQTVHTLKGTGSGEWRQPQEPMITSQFENETQRHWMGRWVSGGIKQRQGQIWRRCVGRDGGQENSKARM